MNRISTIIVDDERPARQRLRDLLANDGEIEIIAECGDKGTAVAAIQEHKPDLIFLDIEMPPASGFDVLRALNPSDIPVTVFVTAYNQYAVQAFDVNALDYLLKPFSDTRFRETISRVKKQLGRISGQSVQKNIFTAIENIEKKLAETERISEPAEEKKQIPGRLAVRTAQRIILLKTADLNWIEAAGVYVKLHTADKQYLYRETIGRLMTQLDTAFFIRIHRSTIVNMNRIRELKKLPSGEYQVVLEDNTRLKLSRNYYAALKKRFDISG